VTIKVIPVAKNDENSFGKPTTLQRRRYGLHRDYRSRAQVHSCVFGLSCSVQMVPTCRSSSVDLSTMNVFLTAKGGVAAAIPGFASDDHSIFTTQPTHKRWKVGTGSSRWRRSKLKRPRPFVSGAHTAQHT
jgi:hypothetical protein